MKKLMIAMLGLSLLGSTVLVAQTPAPAAKSDTAKKAPKKAKKDTSEKKDDTAKKAPKKAKKDTTEKK